jgi:hypothetical protein
MSATKQMDVFQQPVRFKNLDRENNFDLVELPRA